MNETGNNTTQKAGELNIIGENTLNHHIICFAFKKTINSKTLRSCG